MPTPKEFRADGLLLITAFFWGLGFVFQRQGMEHLPPHIYNFARFLLGGGLLLPLGLRQLAQKRRVKEGPQLKTLFFASALAGTVLWAASTFQQIGMVDTTSAKAGFITGLYVVFVPIIGFFLRHRIAKAVWTGAVLATVGLYLLCIDGPFVIKHGDLLIFICAMLWAVHVHVIGQYAKISTPILLAAFQFLTCSVLSLGTSMITEGIISPAALTAGLPAILGNGILSVFIGFTLQVIAQRDAPPTTAAIIMSFEAVFAAIGGVVILHEVMTTRMIIGCLSMLAGMICAQLPEKKGR